MISGCVPCRKNHAFKRYEEGVGSGGAVPAEGR
jgi:hypothetical protein